MSLQTIAYEVKNCTKCPIHCLSEHPIPGIGPNNAKLMIVGQNPAKEEALYGEPLVGRSGKLLEKMLNEAGLYRKDIYLSNVVKCLTTKNREPSNSEIAACQSYIIDEIKEVNPKIIITLGKVPLRTFLNYSNPYKVKSTFKLKDYLGQRIQLPKISDMIYFIPTYHPSFLLQNGRKQYKEVVELFKTVKEQYLDKTNQPQI